MKVYLLSLLPQKYFLEAGMVEHSCNLRTWEAEAGGSQIQGQPELHSRFQATGDYKVKKILFFKKSYFGLGTSGSHL
jgi:hypothetical protein